MTTNISCPRCLHAWTTKSTAWTITCPSCRKIVKNTGVVPVKSDKVEVPVFCPRCKSSQTSIDEVENYTCIEGSG